MMSLETNKRVFLARNDGVNMSERCGAEKPVILNCARRVRTQPFAAYALCASGANLCKLWLRSPGETSRALASNRDVLR